MASYPEPRGDRRGRGAVRHFGSSDWNRRSVAVLPKSSFIGGHTHGRIGGQPVSALNTLQAQSGDRAGG